MHSSLEVTLGVLRGRLHDRMTAGFPLAYSFAFLDSGLHCCWGLEDQGVCRERPKGRQLSPSSSKLRLSP